MNYETKRDVFVDAVDALADAQASGGNVGHQDANLFMAEYDNALPDDLPVIPEAIGEYLKTHRKKLLGEIFWEIGGKSSAFLDSNELYIVLNSGTFVRAWLLGVWSVEETGEVVKL